MSNVKESLVYKVLKDGMVYENERKIYLFADFLNDDNCDEIMDKLFELNFEIDDYHYRWLHEVFSEILNSIEWDEISSLEDINMDSISDDILEGIEADCYTSNLTTWLNSDNGRVYYLTEILEEYGSDIGDGFRLLGAAQELEIREVYEMGIELIKYLIEKEVETEGAEESEEEEN